ncbi:DUF202 domain-containing protein [Streptomyces sp. NPDC018031]|uniref:DUF202 domain-containing protein n=1 Tax=Streptomyces sp. NPDC018031 TaxID=3365033 RepID=UPI0037B1993C
MAEARRDPGLQPERTRLAWRRTTLTGAVVGVLGVRQALRGGPRPDTLLTAALIALAWLAFLAAAHRRIGALALPRPPALSGRAAAVATGCVLVLMVCGVAVLM